MQVKCHDWLKQRRYVGCVIKQRETVKNEEICKKIGKALDEGKC